MRYCGGKSRIGKKIAFVILNLIHNKKVNGFIDCFCGSLSIIKHIIDNFDKCYASDTHQDLIKLWKGLKNGSFDPPKLMTKKNGYN